MVAVWSNSGPLPNVKPKSGKVRAMCQKNKSERTEFEVDGRPMSKMAATANASGRHAARSNGWSYPGCLKNIQAGPEVLLVAPEKGLHLGQ